MDEVHFLVYLICTFDKYRLFNGIVQIAIFNELYIGASGHFISVNGHFNSSFPDPGRREKIESCIKIKINLIVIFTLLCGASKGFMKALKTFIKRFEAPQGSVKVKIKLIFILIQLSEMYWVGRVK